MRKIIFVTPPAHGHVNPTLPIMQELIQRGEQVICYNSPEFRPQIERTGAIFRAYPPIEMTTSAIAQLLTQGNLVQMTSLIFRTTEQLLPFILQELAREQPDLVIFDAIALWGRMAATELQLRAAASIGLFINDERQMGLRDLLFILGLALPALPGLFSARQRLTRQYGTSFPKTKALFPMRAGLNLVYTARELQPDTPMIDQTFRFVGPSINPPPDNQQLPFALPEALPVVYISLGTIHTTHTAFFRTCFAAFGDYPAQFILSAGAQTDLQELGPIPANFMVRHSVPQLAVLQHCDAFITHAGMNSVHEGLYYGVPLVLIPHQFEQLLNARCVVARGAGLLIDNQVKHQPISTPVLRQALDQLLSEPHYRVAAQNIQQSLRATGGYQQAADEIQAYIGMPAG